MLILRLRAAKKNIFIKLFPIFRLLGEPCDSKILIEHYGKHAANLHSDVGMDFKSESAAIYVMVRHIEYFNIPFFETDFT